MAEMEDEIELRLALPYSGEYPQVKEGNTESVNIKVKAEYKDCDTDIGANEAQQNENEEAYQHQASHHQAVVRYEPERSEAATLEYLPCTEPYHVDDNHRSEADEEPCAYELRQKYGKELGLVRNEKSKAIIPTVGAFAVQCARCYKWRFVPDKKEYEFIREYLLENPWVCERAHSWRRNASCDDPTDIVQDDSLIWAMDKPNIVQPPPGWERVLCIRREGATRFGDIYYYSPKGVKLRSMVDIRKYLAENPEFVEAGVNLSQFSFQIPRPRKEGYVRKRSSKSISQGDSRGLKKRESASDAQGNPDAPQDLRICG